jgi:hypothetical protein
MPAIKFLGGQLAGCGIDYAQSKGWIDGIDGVFIKAAIAIASASAGENVLGFSIGVDVFTTLQNTCAAK